MAARFARAYLDDPGSHGVVESPGQHVRGDPKTALKVREPGHSREHRIACDEQAPTLTHDLERAGGGANLTLVEATRIFLRRWIVFLEGDAIGHQNRRK